MWQKIKNLYHWLTALIAAIYFGFPSKKLTVIGVTGTDGKTTTVHMIYQILKDAGKKVSMISSVNAQIDPKTFDTGFHVTTPDPWQIQKFLDQAAQSGSEYFVLEATSHGLDQNRLAFVDFKVAVLTNITHEHLDYHKTWQNYALAKAKLFKNVQFSILNKDDTQSYNLLKNRANGQIVTYGQKTPSDITLTNFPIKLKIPGFFNLSNAQAAATVCQVLGIDKKVIFRALLRFSGVIGRLEEVKMGQNFKVIVDFAHTPNGLASALKTLRSSLARGRLAKLIAVFGAAGQRDKLKRPLMGQVADIYADVVILTAEDPRREKVEDIFQEIAKGIKKKKEGQDLFKIPDRSKAIEFAINFAQKGDTVATFGKSHEKSLTYGKKDYPWDEFATVKKALQKRLKHER